MSDIYEWHVTDPRPGAPKAVYGSVDEAFAARAATARDVVFVVLKATGFRARVLRPG